MCIEIDELCINVDDSRLELTMYDWNVVGANDPMGKVVLPLDEILYGKFEPSRGIKSPEPEPEPEPEPVPEVKEVAPEGETKEEMRAREKATKERQKLEKQARKDAEKRAKQGLKDAEKERHKLVKEQEKAEKQRQREEVQEGNENGGHGGGSTDGDADEVHSKNAGTKTGQAKHVLDPRGIQDPEGLWLPLRPLVR